MNDANDKEMEIPPPAKSVESAGDRKTKELEERGIRPTDLMADVQKTSELAQVFDNLYEDHPWMRQYNERIAKLVAPCVVYSLDLTIAFWERPDMKGVVFVHEDPKDAGNLIYVVASDRNDHWDATSHRTEQTPEEFAAYLCKTLVNK